MALFTDSGQKALESRRNNQQVSEKTLKKVESEPTHAPVTPTTPAIAVPPGTVVSAGTVVPAATAGAEGSPGTATQPKNKPPAKKGRSRV